MTHQTTTAPKKTFTRTFAFTNALYFAAPLVHEVIDAIENDELKVYDPHNKDTYFARCDENHVTQLEECCTLPISIRQWLPVGCQIVRWDICHGRDTCHECDLKDTESPCLARYCTNADTVICPPYADWQPPGPTAFYGQIIVSAQLNLSSVTNTVSGVTALKGLIAHELTHTFDMMKIVVPALMDWPAFWTNLLGEGCESDLLLDCHHAVTNFVHEQELDILRAYWPSHAAEWHQGLNAFIDTLSENPDLCADSS